MPRRSQKGSFVSVPPLHTENIVFSTLVLSSLRPQRQTGALGDSSFFFPSSFLFMETHSLGLL